MLAASGAPAAQYFGYHGGPVLVGEVPVFLIYYGDWPGGHPARDIFEHLVSNLGGSEYYNILTEYYMQSAGIVMGMFLQLAFARVL